jgi:serine phosphatase RsbU (regulator of sigma subunit)
VPLTIARPSSDAAALAGLHVHRTQAELEQALQSHLIATLPGVDFALCLANGVAGADQLRFTIGDQNPLRGKERVRREDWPLPSDQRLPVLYLKDQLGELLVGGPLEPAERLDLERVLLHFGTALANITLNAESRQATEDYCASLQALEEGIVLFQEGDPEAVAARLLSLASSMVNAAAGALYVLNEIGKPESGLRFEQALGMPEQMLAGFHGVDGCVWPDVLLPQLAHLAVRAADVDGAAAEDASMAMLAPDCIPAILQSVVVLPLRYHGVQAGLCLLFNPLLDTIQPRDFIGRLHSFSLLAAAVLHRLSLEAMTANNQMIARELEIAETIQKRLQPSAAPPTDEYEFAWSTIAAKNIGGDYLDAFRGDNGDVFAVVADASGHGINSALLMSSFRSNYRGRAASTDPSSLAGWLNGEVVHEVGPTGMFITAGLVRFERCTRMMNLCSAGHCPPLLYRAATGRIETIDTHGPPLGFVGGERYESYETKLEPGDILVLYTDGITEAANADLDMFGEERLVALLQREAGSDVAAIAAAVQREMVKFTGRDRYDDDVSLLVVKTRPVAAAS